MAMKYDDESFDCVIDKSVIDTMLCSADGPRCARAMIGEIQRVLKPRGRYICISLHPLRDVLHRGRDGHELRHLPPRPVLALAVGRRPDREHVLAVLELPRKRGTCRSRL